MNMENKKINTKILSMFGQAGSIFGMSLPEIMKERVDLMILTADMSTPAGLDKFKGLYPDNFVNLGIAEQNMIGVASGLSDEGFKTVSVAQACFLSMRDFEPVRQYCGYMKSAQVLVGISSGFSLAYLGNTHYALEDIALMKQIPGMYVIAPSDSLEAIKAFESALETDAPVYIRLHGGLNLSVVHKEDINFRIGQAIELQAGKDLQIIATGSMVSRALAVVGELEANDISCAVTDMHTIKPLDTKAIRTDVKMIVTLEEHSILGGLGSSVADFLCKQTTHPSLLKIGVEDRFSQVGGYEYLMEQNGLSVERMKSKIQLVYNQL